MTEFFGRLNDSSWKGIISEVGLGLEFSSRFLRVPGASRTIIGVNCDYAGLNVPKGVRSVSLENAKLMAHENLTAAVATAAEFEPTEERFGLAITGAHYQDRDSHGWIYLATPKWDAYMHFTVAPPQGKHGQRGMIANVVVERAQWFLNACMLERGSWAQHIESIGDTLETDHIDVLYGPGLSDIERLLLLRQFNPLAYYDGKFQRVVDIVRDYPTVYPGAFNPPTKWHLNVGEPTLFELSQQHCYKGSMNLEDLLHRIRMLNVAGRPTLITRAPRFIDKVDMLRSVCGADEIEFLVGADAWNATIVHHQYPSTNFLAEALGNTNFRVMPRMGVDIDHNQVGDTLKMYEEVADRSFEGVNSTAVRNADFPGRHEYLTPEVQDYVTRTGLYSKSVVQ
jgi:nicotinic acid mononucleotide adenylyltransferase